MGLLREYLEDARIIRDGKIVRVKPFETVGMVIFSTPIGKCEAFCTDGLATLLYTMKEMKILDEKTVRWPGHAEKIRFLIEMGLFSKEKVTLDGAAVTSGTDWLERIIARDPRRM